MPFQHRTNNRVLPANSRAVDVAKRTLESVIPVEQRRYANAFEVDGIETIVYNRLSAGLACSCQANQRTVRGVLNHEGKLPTGHINSLLTGGLVFEVTPYGARQPMRHDLRALRGEPPKERDDQIFDGLEDVESVAGFDLGAHDLSDPFADVVSDSHSGANGTVTGQTLDDVVKEFDADAFLNDTRCTVCYGTGHVGGYSVLNGLRLVLSTQWPDTLMNTGTIEMNQSPHAFYAGRVDFRVTLPRGVVGVDCFRRWNNDIQLPMGDIFIDNLPYSVELLRAFCDGRPHVISFRDASDDWHLWTHLELQFNLSHTPALFELPRVNEGSNLMLEDGTDDLGINASPAIPSLRREDILAECTLGKILVVTSSNFWNDNRRNVLGWDAQTRVIQPSELLNLLPRRRSTRQKSTYMVRDNGSGTRRT